MSSVVVCRWHVISQSFIWTTNEPACAAKFLTWHADKLEWHCQVLSQTVSMWFTRINWQKGTKIQLKIRKTSFLLLSIAFGRVNGQMASPVERYFVSLLCFGKPVTENGFCCRRAPNTLSCFPQTAEYMLLKAYDIGKTTESEGNLQIGAPFGSHK